MVNRRTVVIHECIGSECSKTSHFDHRQTKIFGSSLFSDRQQSSLHVQADWQS